MKFFLLPFSLLYQFGCQVKNLFFQWKILKPKKAQLHVISVGNITFGGSEKTPLVMNLLSFLTKKGYKPALISRGYKGKWEKSGGILSIKKTTPWGWKDSGDEPFMVAQNIPQAGIFIGKNRLLSCIKASQLGFDVAVLDDGFQHRRLHRDLDIVLFDASERIILREPFSSLKRAHILLMKKGIAVGKRKRIRGYLPKTTVFEYSIRKDGYFRLGKKEREPSENLKGKRVLAFCGMARPERFFSSIEEDIKPLFFLKFPDHYHYPLFSLNNIIKKYQELHAEAIITTEKDAVKILHYKGFRNIPVYYLKIDLNLERKFYSRVLSFLRSKT